MHIDKYLKDGQYVDEDNCHYGDAESFIMTGLLGFCGCGLPERAMEFTRDVLQHIDSLTQDVWERGMTYDQWHEAGKKLFPTSGMEYFAYYVLDEKGLTEHGSSVPGWLTDKGRHILEDMNKILSEQD